MEGAGDLMCNLHLSKMPFLKGMREAHRAVKRIARGKKPRLSKAVKAEMVRGQVRGGV